MNWKLSHQPTANYFSVDHFCLKCCLENQNSLMRQNILADDEKLAFNRRVASPPAKIVLDFPFESSSPNGFLFEEGACIGPDAGPAVVCATTKPAQEGHRCDVNCYQISHTCRDISSCHGLMQSDDKKITTSLKYGAGSRG